MEIKSSVNIGDSVYYLVPIRNKTCPICNGSKKINIVIETGFSLDDANKSYDCPECKGKGKIKTNIPYKYQIKSGVVKMIDIAINEIGQVYTYVVEKESGGLTSLTMDECFTTMEDAEHELFFKNLYRPTVPIDQIVIPNSFKRTIPANEKLMKRIDEYRRNGKLDVEIYVDENYQLFDGYTAYLIYKMFGYTEVPVVVFPDKNITQPQNKGELA